MQNYDFSPHISHIFFSGHEACQAWTERIWNGEVHYLLSIIFLSYLKFFIEWYSSKCHLGGLGATEAISHHHSDGVELDVTAWCDCQWKR